MTTERLSNVIRRKFVDYFVRKHGHQFVPYSSVKPRNDKTISFVNAGMNQFKGLFLEDLPKYETPRVCNYQKCIRVGGKLCDLDLIGHDHRHHTFFEMLGNWSFNDYGKANACEWALDFLVNELKLDMHKISVTYHSDNQEEDLETKNIWRSLGLAPNKIVANNKGDNFWTMGNTGPCGLSTEIFYPSCGEASELLEIWNLVFIDRLKLCDDAGLVTIKPLVGKFVDTGMGLERLLSILCDVNSNYQTDLFVPLFKTIERKSPAVQPYSGRLDNDLDVNYRILVDHCRTITVALADGIEPGRKGADFDLRSMIKKCILISKDKFKQAEPRLLLFDLVDETVNILSDAYPELKKSVSNTRRVLAFESKRYLRHLARDAPTHEACNLNQDPCNEPNVEPRKIRNIKQVFRMGESLSKQNQLLRLAGRVSSFRMYKNFSFLDINDGSCIGHLQVVIGRNILDKPELGSYVICDGYLLPSRGPKQPVEFKAHKLAYLGDCDPSDYPLASRDEPSRVWYRKNLHLRPRSGTFASLLRVRSELEICLHMIMKQMDFIRVHTPSITSNDSEASSDLFTINRSKLANAASASSGGDDSDDDGEEDSDEDDSASDEESLKDHASPNAIKSKRFLANAYFGKDVFLTTSAQLHLETLAASLSRVYTLSSTFRAENCNSTKHLSEFVMFEAEEADVVQVHKLMDRVESIIKFVAQYCKEVSEFSEDLEHLISKSSIVDQQQIFDKLCRNEYVRMTYDEALDILANKVSGFELPTAYGCDLSRRHELKLLEYCNQVPVFVTHYPQALKPFYMKTQVHDKRPGEIVTESFDLLAPLSGELCGGSLREDDLGKLTSNKNVGGGNFDWYLDSRRYGSFPHGGFGLGMDRLLQSMLGIPNIKDTSAFPRWVKHCHT